MKNEMFDGVETEEFFIFKSFFEYFWFNLFSKKRRSVSFWIQKKLHKSEKTKSLAKTITRPRSSRSTSFKTPTSSAVRCIVANIR